jgi:hypothetical protein
LATEVLDVTLGTVVPWPLVEVDPMSWEAEVVGLRAHLPALAPVREARPPAEAMTPWATAVAVAPE